MANGYTVISGCIENIIIIGEFIIVRCLNRRIVLLWSCRWKFRRQTARRYQRRVGAAVLPLASFEPLRFPQLG